MAAKARASVPRASKNLSVVDSSSEEIRLETLRNYHILDTPPERVFDDLVQLAAYICGTPVALVSLTDAERQWFKAQVGLSGVDSMAREDAFCQYAMLSDDVLEVQDTTQNPLFQGNPLVTEAPHVRFYAGAPLTAPGGHFLGTLCALDTVPRRLDDAQRHALRVLAREVVAHLELRRARLQLEQEQRKLEGLLRMANDASESLYLTNGHMEIFIKQDHKLIRLSTLDIRYVEALGDYVNIYANRERYTVYSTMKELEAKLPARDFARVHRKYIVRLDRIMAIESDAVVVEAGRSSEAASGVISVPIGNSYKATLLGRINLI